MIRYSFNDSIRLDNSRYSDLKDFKDLRNFAKLNSNLELRLRVRFKALRESREYSSDLESYIYYIYLIVRSIRINIILIYY